MERALDEIYIKCLGLMINEHSAKTISLCNLVIVISFHFEILQFRKKYFDCSVMSPEKAAFTNTVRLSRRFLISAIAK